MARLNEIVFLDSCAGQDQDQEYPNTSLSHPSRISDLQALHLYLLHCDRDTPGTRDDAINLQFNPYLRKSVSVTILVTIKRTRY